MIKDYSCNYCGSKQSTTLYDGIKDWEYGVPGTFSYRECISCKGVQLYPFPEMPELIEAYNIDYHGYTGSGNKGFLYKILFDINDKLLKRKLKRIIPPNAKVLDVGCGSGEMLAALGRMGASELDGIDFSDKAIAMVASKGINGFKGTFDQFEKQDNYYDVIVMNNYLEHTVNPMAELKKARRLLRPGGYLIGEIPGYDSYERRIFKKYWGGNHVPRHTHQYNQGFLKKIVKEAGFKTIKIEHELNTGHAALSIQNYMQRNVADLRNNKKIVHGRSKLYYLLLMAFIPFNIIPVLMKKSGVIKFYAVS